MQRWWRHASSALAEVADRPALWLPGALTWTLTVGWLMLLLGVARPPTEADLTFIGAGLFTSGAWPWNAIAIGAAALAAALVAFTFASAGEAVLLGGRRIAPRSVGRLLVLALVCATPVLVILLGMGMALIVVAPAEFNAPEAEPGALARTAVRLSPFLVGLLVAMAAGGAFHAASARRAMAGSAVAEALRSSPGMLRAAGPAALLQAAAALLARAVYVSLGAILLRVLWAPIGEQLMATGIDLAVALLLVGFVAIWLCLVLGGGALHAWGSVSWTRVLGRSPERMETSTGP